MVGQTLGMASHNEFQTNPRPKPHGPRLGTDEIHELDPVQQVDQKDLSPEVGQRWLWLTKLGPSRPELANTCFGQPWLAKLVPGRPKLASAGLGQPWLANVGHNM